MFVTSGSASLAYDVDGEPGDGVDLVMVHAGVTDRRSWRPLVSAVGAGRRCVTFDQRGYGETTYSLEEHSRAGDVLAVMDAVGLESAILVGASMGGKVCLDLALEHPGRVSALVLIGPAVSGAPEPQDAYPEPLASMEKALEAADEMGDLDEVNRLEAHLWLDGPTAPEGRVGGEVRDLFLEMNGRALAAADPGDAPGTVDAWSRLEELTMPALVILGALDLPDIRDGCRAVAERAKDARLVVLPGVAHLPHLEGNPQCLRAVGDFLDGLSAR